MKHHIVHRDEFAYCAHPHIAVARNGDWLVVFNRAPRRPYVLHPPEQPLYQNVMIRSSDSGSSWSAPQVVPNYDFWGTECAGLTVLRDGQILLNQWRFDWYPLSLARKLPGQADLTYPDVFMRGWINSPEHETSGCQSMPSHEIAPWVRGGGRTFVHISADHGQSFQGTSEISTAPFSGGYGMRGAVELRDGTIILPLSDIPHYRQIFTVSSRDGGRTWSEPALAAKASGREYEEPTIIQTDSGKLLMILRDNATRHLHQIASYDAGASWSAPVMLDIEGYPAHLLALDDGRLLLTYGWRMPDFGVRAAISTDDGETWNTTAPIRIRGGLPSKNLGYPATVNGADGQLFTVYYGEDDEGVTCIMATRWRLSSLEK